MTQAESDWESSIKIIKANGGGVGVMEVRGKMGIPLQRNCSPKIPVAEFTFTGKNDDNLFQKNK